MTNRTDLGSPDAIVLTHALEKLRARDGLTSSRLETAATSSPARCLVLQPYDVTPLCTTSSCHRPRSMSSGNVYATTCRLTTHRG